MLGNMLNLDDFTILNVSNYLSLGFSALLIVAGYMDWKEQEVSDIILIPLALLLTFNALCFSTSVLACIICMLSFLYTFFLKENGKFGQADGLIIAHLFTGYTLTSVGTLFIIIACILWLLFLIAHLIIICVNTKTVWKPFSGFMMPAIPSYTVSVLAMIPIRFLFTESLFFSGW